MHDGSDLQYLLTDHLGSVVGVMDDQGTLLSQQRYLPFGGARLSQGVGQTDFGYTGQRALNAIGLMDYNARWYGQGIGRFTQPDIIIPNHQNPQSLNRYSYTYNNPIRYSDPTGHCPICVTAVIGAVIGGVGSAVIQAATTGTVDWGQAAGAAAAGAIVGAGGFLFGTGLAATVGTGAVAGAVAGEVERITTNAITGRSTEFSAERAIVNAVAGAGGAAVGYGLVRGIQGAANLVRNIQGGGLGSQSVPGMQSGNLDLRTGMSVYRVWGGSLRKGALPNGSYWSPVDPRTIPNYRYWAGLPDWNTGEFLSIGRLANTAGVEISVAASVSGNPGGLTELVIPDPVRQVILDRVIKLVIPY